MDEKTRLTNVINDKLGLTITEPIAAVKDR